MAEQFFSRPSQSLQKLPQQNNQIQHALSRFYKKAGKWPANVEQLDQYIGVVKQPGTHFIIMDQGNYQQIFDRDHDLAGKVIKWQIYLDTEQKWRWALHLS